MQTNISTRHGQLSPLTKSKITEKVEKLRRFYDRVTAIDVTVDLEHRESVDVEVCVSAEHAQDFVARESRGELFASLDGVVHKLEQQLRKHKQKIQSGHRQPGRKQFEPPLDDEGDLDDEEAE